MENSQINADDTGAVAGGDVHIESGQYAAGRDIIIETNYGESEWTSVNLAAYSVATSTPVFTESLLQQLKDNRVLILARGVGFDKDEFSKHLAWRISQDFSLTALEKDSDDTRPKDLFSTIKQWETKSLFILSGFSPKDVGFNIEKLAECAQSGHFIIVTTDLGLNTWQLLPHHEKKYWFEIPSSGLYEQSTINTILINRLNEILKNLLFEQTIKTFTAETKLLSYEAISITAKSFQTPEQVILFVDLLQLEKKPITDTAIQELLKSFSNKNEALVSKWFKNLNSEREKLLVIAAALLDGVYEDQFFEILKEITEAFWHYREPSLYALDYGDLDFLENFFRFDDETGRGSVIKGRFPFQRADILRCAWQTHRRHITSAIPVLNNIAQQSRYTRNTKKDLYSNRQRRMVLRGVITETFSDIGIMYLPAVEEKLLRLAATGDDSLHRITAKAIVRWKFLDKEDQLYSLIWKWLGNDDASRQIADILQEDIVEQKSVFDNKAKRYLHKVVIMAIEYIVESEPPNQLSLRVIELVHYLVNETQDIAIELYKRLVSKLLVSHFHQVKPIFLPEFISDKSRSEFIAVGMVSAYEEHPSEVKDWLNEWMDLCLTNETGYDLLLRTLLKAYYELLSNNEFGYEEIWGKIEKLYILRKDNADKYLFYSIVKRLFEVNIENSLSHIKFLFDYSTVYERQNILECLTEVYKTQREQLSGSSAFINVEDKIYPYWYNSTRPFTKIEEVMFDWMHNDDEATRDIAILTLAEFAIHFDKKERSAIPIIRSQTQNQQQEENRSFIFSTPTPLNRQQVAFNSPAMSLYSRIIIFLWLLFETKENKIIIRQYIKTLLLHPFVFDSGGIKILTRNLRLKNTQRTIKVARWLERLYGIR